LKKPKRRRDARINQESSFETSQDQELTESQEAEEVK
jgi:hypothetical protein